ncbi:hypothetical protein M0802_015531, partial [Mischocyttarus mexicanus]
IIGFVAIPKDEKRSHIILAIGLAEAESYSDIGLMRQRSKVKTVLDSDLSHKPKIDPISREAIP